jgi:hypothetical protein
MRKGIELDDPDAISSPCGRGRAPLGAAEWEGEGRVEAPEAALTLPPPAAALSLSQKEREFGPSP